MRERTCLGKPRNGFNRRARTRADNNVFSAKNARSAFGKCYLNRFWSDKASRPHEQLCPARLEIIEMHLDQPINHLPLAITHKPQVNLGIVLVDAEFFTSPKVGCYLLAMDDIFARETGDVGTGTSDIFSLNNDR